MTPISEQQSKELEVQAAAATSHDAPVPYEEAATRDDARNADQERQQAARRERDFLAGIRKLIKSFKSLSHIFEIYKEEDDEDENMDMGIEIGFPTDVQHVAHIGLDGSTNVSSLRGLKGARELLSHSNLTTLEQFELAMASLAAPSKEYNNAVLERVSSPN